MFRGCSIFVRKCHTGWRRPIGCHFVIIHLSQKSPILNGSFAENNQQLKASYGSSPPCTHQTYLNTHQTKYHSRVIDKSPTIDESSYKKGITTQYNSEARTRT